MQQVMSHYSSLICRKEQKIGRAVVVSLVPKMEGHDVRTEYGNSE